MRSLAGRGPEVRGVSDEDRRELGMLRCSDCEHSDPDGRCEVWRNWQELDAPVCGFFEPHFG